MKIPLTMTQLRDELAEAFANVKADRRYAVQARELSNIAGKMLDTAKIDLIRAALVGEEPSDDCMKFIGKGSGRSLLPKARRLALEKS